MISIARQVSGPMSRSFWTLLPSGALVFHKHILYELVEYSCGIIISGWASPTNEGPESASCTYYTFPKVICFCDEIHSYLDNFYCKQINSGTFLFRSHVGLKLFHFNLFIIQLPLLLRFV